MGNDRDCRTTRPCSTRSSVIQRHHLWPDGARAAAEAEEAASRCCRPARSAAAAPKAAAPAVVAPPAPTPVPPRATPAVGISPPSRSTTPLTTAEERALKPTDAVSRMPQLPRDGGRADGAIHDGIARRGAGRAASEGPQTDGDVRDALCGRQACRDLRASGMPVSAAAAATAIGPPMRAGRAADTRRQRVVGGRQGLCGVALEDRPASRIGCSPRRNANT